jgi:alpha-beta hydrolase superfamily lysophospholipase
VWHQNIAAGFGSDILSHGDKILDKAGTFITPSLFLTGSGDQIVSVAGVLKFYQHCSSQDKTYITLDGWYHELLNEPLNLMLMPLITDWLKPRLALADGEIIQTNVHSIATDPVQGSPDQRLRIAPVNNA